MAATLRQAEMQLAAVTAERDSFKALWASLETTLGSNSKQLTDLRIDHDRALASYRVRAANVLKSCHVRLALCFAPLTPAALPNRYVLPCAVGV